MGGPLVEMIPIDRIQVLNPRARNRNVHREITENIAEIGLKRPITVARRRASDGSERYDLVCGEGRLEAFQALGQTEAPAVVIDAPPEECLIMSLVENIARRQHGAVEQLREISTLRTRGYNDAEVAQKLGCTSSWVSLVRGLLEKGEDRLLAAVDSGLIPLSLAVDIAKSDDDGVQLALTEAYEAGKIKGKNVAIVRRMLERRNRHGPIDERPYGRSHGSRRLTAEQLLQMFQREAERQRLAAKKADFVESRLMFVVQALKELLRDEGFVDLLRAEHLETLPQGLVERMAANAG